MTYFDKKFSFWLVAFLVLLNIGSLAALWLYRQPPHPPQPPPHAEDGLSNFIAKELGFDEEQTAELKVLRRKFKETSRPLVKGKNESKKLMFDAITRESPDTLAAMIHARSIGDKQQKLEVAQIQHYLDMLDICSPEQQKKLAKIFHRAMRQGRPQEPPPPGK